MSIRFERLVRGFDDVFYAPHSRHTEVKREDVLAVSDLVLLSESKQAGVYIVLSADRRHVFVTGHSEYDPLTLQGEYVRDVSKGLPIAVPKQLLPGRRPARASRSCAGAGHSNLLFANWLNYYVYQQTPYDLGQIPAGGTSR